MDGDPHTSPKRFVGRAECNTYMYMKACMYQGSRRRLALCTSLIGGHLPHCLHMCMDSIKCWKGTRSEPLQYDLVGSHVTLFLIYHQVLMF